MDKADWKESWKEHLNNYLNGVPRTGIFIKSLFRSVKKTLELGCGSSRDSIFLAKNKINATATDYEEETISFLNNQFKSDYLNYEVADAFNLPKADKSFELVFHNGLFVLFNDDDQIIKMLKEQCRVSKKYILIFVHNVKNKRLQELFKQKKINDKIYDIRFFGKDEFLKIIKNSDISCKQIRFLKFGGKFDLLYNMFPYRYFSLMLEFIVPRLYQIQRWSRTERVVCVLEVS